MAFLKNNHFIFLNNRLGKNYTGIESSALKRSKIFIEKLNIIPVFLTMAYNLNTESIVEELKALKKIPDSFKHVNLYQFYQTESVTKAISYLEPIENLTEPRVQITQNQKKLFTKFYNLETGLISYIHYYDDNGEIYRLDNFDPTGFLSRVCVFTTGKTRERVSEFFYRADGTLCFQKFYSHKNGENVVDRITVTDEVGRPTKVFNEEEDFTKFLLEFYFNKYSENEQVNVIVDRNVRLIDGMDNRVIPNLKIYPIIHSYHLQGLSNPQSRLRSYAYYLNNIRDIDGLIILTEQQRYDIVKRFGEYDNTYCIPHVVNDFPQKVPFDSRITNKVIAVGRYSPEKNHELMIRIFAKVVERLPSATLDLYGHGPLKSKLESLIKDLNMEENISINPFSKDIYAKFSEAKLSLLTSEYEGFPLVVMESLACGCPVIANDIRYGPSSMIDDGKNGYLIDRDDESAFVDKIVKVLKDESLNAEFSKNAYESSQRFSDDNIAPVWQSFIEKITK
ncbi:glycosyltransferase [Otariodibacter sp.]|uniref:glycosyltransferase n=1 Tax=Otariodibacter sp. TaxID=3030919 RepID=UPI00260625DA|nr:glycosyltransferase [Otariodibacter sp.]